jgi:hypothetical protein
MSSNLTVVRDQPGWGGCFWWIPLETASRLGAPAAATVAVKVDLNGPDEGINLVANQPYRMFIQRNMPLLLTTSPTIRAVAARTTAGWLAIPDGRSFELWAKHPFNVALPNAMTIGMIEVSSRLVLVGTYLANPNYRGYDSQYGAWGHRNTSRGIRDDPAASA